MTKATSDRYCSNCATFRSSVPNRYFDLTGSMREHPHPILRNALPYPLSQLGDQCRRPRSCYLYEISSVGSLNSLDPVSDAVVPCDWAKLLPQKGR